MTLAASVLALLLVLGISWIGMTVLASYFHSRSDRSEDLFEAAARERRGDESDAGSSRVSVPNNGPCTICNGTGAQTNAAASVRARAVRERASASATVLPMLDTSQKPVIATPETEPPTDLVVDDVVVGEGPVAGPGMIVNVDYVGVSWSTGAEFDASWDRGSVFSFALGGGMVIPGWDEGVDGMKVGGRRQLTIPPDMAYGKSGAGAVIGPDETLIFVVDLRSIG